MWVTETDSQISTQNISRSHCDDSSFSVSFSLSPMHVSVAAAGKQLLTYLQFSYVDKVFGCVSVFPELVVCVCLCGGVLFIVISEPFLVASWWCHLGCFI